MSIKYQNLHSFKEGLILLFQSILETKRITHLHGSAFFTIPLILCDWQNCYMYHGDLHVHSLLKIRLFSFRRSSPSPLPKTSNIGHHHVHHYDHHQITVLTDKVIWKKLLTIFAKKTSIVDVRLGSKYTSENFRFSSKGYSCKFQTIRSSPPEVFWGKVVLKICSKFTEEHPCWSVISIKLLCIALIALLRSHFGMGVLL